MNAKNLRRKLNTSSGFTLAEALVAILILLMVSSVVASGIPAARNAYEKVVLASNAEVLLSTTISSLRNELGTASTATVDKDDETTITYFNPSINATSKISLNSESATGGNDPAGVIMYQRYAGVSSGIQEKEGTVTRLVSEQASTQRLYATYDSAKIEDGIITFTNLTVHQASKDGNSNIKSNLTSREKLSIRIISITN